jgi:hypothetical protein
VKPIEFAKPETAAPPEPKPAAPDPKPAPKAPAPKADTPKLVVPQVPTPAAPTGAGSEGDKIPPLIPRLPNPDMPPLTLPQVPLEKPNKGTSTSKASPLTDAPRVDVFPVDGPPPAGPTAKRSVGFFNHTDRDLKLTVEGETVTLPRRHYVSATVPATFAWKLDGDERRTEVPAAAPGVEVVIRK